MSRIASWIGLGLIVASAGLWLPVASQQQVFCPTRPPGDSTNACASTAFVQGAVGNISLPLPNGEIYIGNASNVATPAAVLPLANGGLGGSQTGATANQIPVFPGSGGAAVPTSIPGVGGLFDTICSSTIGQLWVRATGGWGCASLGFINVAWFGAVNDGVTDNSAVFATAFAAAATVGTIVVPQGVYCLFSGWVINRDHSQVLGSGGVELTTCGHDAIPLQVGDATQHQRIRFADMEVDGFNSPTATQPTIWLRNCVACRLDRIDANFGSNVVLVNGSSTYTIWSSGFSSAYSTADMEVLGASGGWLVRTAIDQNWPNGVPTLPITINNWSASASIANKQFIQLSTNWWLQAMNAGTTGSTQPSITATFTGAISGTTLTDTLGTGALQIGQTVFGNDVAPGTKITAGSGTSWTVSVSQAVASEAMTSGFPYNSNIVDGTVTWQLVGANNHDSIRYDTGTSQAFEWGTDHSGPYRFGINVINSQAGTAPSLLNFTDMVATGVQAAAEFQAGSHILMENSQIQNCQQAACSGIRFETTFGGFATIHGNDVTGNVNGINIQGPLSAAYISLGDNVIQATTGAAITVGSASITHYVINNNICSTSPTGINDLGSAPKIVQASCP